MILSVPEYIYIGIVYDNTTENKNIKQQNE